MSSVRNECSTTHNSGFYRCVEAEDCSYRQKNGWYYAHDNECELPLDSECNDIRRKEERDALDESIQFLSNALVNTVAVWEVVLATEPCIMDDDMLVVICIAGDPFPPLSKCHTSCLSRLSKNAFLMARVVLVAAIQMHSVAT